MFTLGPREALIGAGSNAPNALEMLRRARAELRAHPLLRLGFCSPLYESDALLPPGAPRDWDIPFLNAAFRVELDPSLCWDAPAVIAILKTVEKKLGRTEAPRWAPRVIDLDLLAWAGPDTSNAAAQVRHPGLLERPFALLPAQDSAGSVDADLGRAWRLGPREQVPLHTRRASSAWPELVAILNVTPDSFSGGALAPKAEALQARVAAWIRDGATVIDVGAESTRPGAVPVAPEEELRRLVPVLGPLFELKKRLGFRISLDSRHPETVAEVLESFPLDWINDVEGFSDPRMAEVARESRCELVAMHSLGVPPSQSRILDPARDPVAQIVEWARARIGALADRGIDPARVILDPGIGFGKTAAQNLALLREAHGLNAAGVRFLIGHSRKRYLDPENRVPAEERDLETAILTSRLASSGADYLRVHEPAPQGRALILGNRGA